MGAEGASKGGTVEAKELVAVSGTPRVPARSGEGEGLDGVAALLEPLDGPRGVVDLQYPFDHADRDVVLDPAGLEYYFNYVPARIARAQLRYCHM